MKEFDGTPTPDGWALDEVWQKLPYRLTPQPWEPAGPVLTFSLSHVVGGAAACITYLLHDTRDASNAYLDIIGPKGNLVRHRDLYTQHDTKWVVPSEVDIDEGGWYTAVVAAGDANGNLPDPVYRDRSNRRMFSATARAYVPEAHNYGATWGGGGNPFHFAEQASRAANWQKELPDTSFYVAKVNHVAGSTNILTEAAAKASVVCLNGHGRDMVDAAGTVVDTGGLIVTPDGEAIVDTVRAGVTLGHQEPLASHDLSRVNLICFVGCYTAKTSAYYGNLLEAATRAGAKAALGFDKGLLNNVWCQGPYWTDVFWKALTGRGPCDWCRWTYVHTVQAAADCAGQATERWDADDSWRSHQIRGGTALTVAPAR